MKQFFSSFFFFSFFILCNAQESNLSVLKDSLNGTNPQVYQSPINRKDIVRLGVYGGYSNLTGAIPKGIDPFLADHIKRLKKGFHIGADVDFFVGKHIALGAKYSIFVSKDEMNNIAFYWEDGTTTIGKISERLFVHYVAPNIIVKAGKSTGKVFFIFDGSMGCLIYRNSGTLIQSDYTMKGAAFGMTITPGIDIKVTQNFALSLNVGLTIGTVNTMTMTIDGQTITDEAKENVTRVDLSLGFRLYK